MKLFQSRKGVSPLAATLLLIIFAIALGVLTMSIGGSFFEEKVGQQDLPENAITLPFSAEGNEYTVTLQDLRIVGDGGTLSKSVECVMPHDFQIGQVNKIALIP